MSNIRVISASAGTGKTFRLTELVINALSQPVSPVQPERVMAVTYTRKAAGELQSRIRQRLMESGDARLTEAGSRIRDGYVGTIHSICQRLLWEFCLDARLSPMLELLPESERRLLFRQTLAALPEDAALLEAASRMDLQVDAEVIAAVDKARANRMDAEALRASAKRSLERLFELAPPSEGDAVQRDAAVLKQLEGAVSVLEAQAAEGGAAAERADLATALLASARSIGTPPWALQVKAAKALAVKKLQSHTGQLVELLTAHNSHPRFRADLEKVVSGVLALAEASLDRFSQRKNAARVIDYDDMLALTLRLLECAPVQEALRERVELLLVDEFQDTSPMQLAIIQRVAELARETVWVGDRKQAIFGFQGSDPELMTAAVEHALAGKAPEIQKESWRSRPGLVSFCSAVFAEGLKPYGFPPEQVELKPARTERPELKGIPYLQTWRFAKSKDAKERYAVASGVAQLLAERPLVRAGALDAESVRPLQRSDLAVLCYTNAHCKEVAEALKERGIAAVVRLEGLGETEESKLCVAALRLLADPYDGVAAATLSWLAGGAGASPDGWLAREVEAFAAWRALPEATRERRPLPFADDPAVRAIRAEHARARVLSPSEALDVCIVAAELPRICMALPDSAQRLANLESLRAAATAFEDLCRVRRIPGTVAGLVDHLSSTGSVKNDSGEEVGDAQAVPPGAEAVTVATYHKAKGLEWPVVVMTDLSSSPKSRVFGMNVDGAPGGYDGAWPLDGRSLRYWPWPYGKQSSGIALADAANQSEEGVASTQRELRERARLLYVGFTRARDQLILVAGETKSSSGTGWLDELKATSGEPVLELPWRDEGIANARVKGRAESFPCVARTVDAVRPEDASNVQEARRWFRPVVSVSARAPELIRPSEVLLPVEVAAQVRLLSPRAIASRQPVQASSELMGAVGDAIHRFLAADHEPWGEAQRLKVAQTLLDAHGVALAISPTTLLQVSDGLRAEMNTTFAGARWFKEWPVRWLVPTRDGNRLLVGEVDLVLELEDRLVLIDHKSFPGGPRQRDERAVAHAGQLAAYRAALESAFEKPVAAMFIHFALLGELVSVEVPAGAFTAWLESATEAPAPSVVGVSR